MKPIPETAFGHRIAMATAGAYMVGEVPVTMTMD